MPTLNARKMATMMGLLRMVLNQCPYPTGLTLSDRLVSKAPERIWLFFPYENIICAQGTQNVQKIVYEVHSSSVNAAVQNLNQHQSRTILAVCGHWEWSMEKIIRSITSRVWKSDLDKTTWGTHSFTELHLHNFTAGNLYSYLYQQVTILIRIWKTVWPSWYLTSQANISTAFVALA